MENWNWLRSQLTPPQVRSWQTLILCSFATWFLSFLVVLSEPDIEFYSSPLTRLGWVFFLVGLIWWQSIHPWKLGPISFTPSIIAAVFCSLFLQNNQGQLSQWVFLIYPILTTLIAALPYCQNKNSRPSLPSSEQRPLIIIQLLIALLCSCWLQLTFVLQDWIETYPNLAIADLSHSQFVLRTGTPFQLRGYELLATIQEPIEGFLSGHPWSEIERRLLDVRQNPEDFWRSLNIKPSDRIGSLKRYPQAQLTRDADQGYYLTITLYWYHPWFEEQREHLSLRCHLYPVPNPEELTNPNPPNIGIITCNTDSQQLFKPMGNLPGES
ncbi:hypothetical protein E1H12_06885 [Geitlerinema sp. P-1104]|uniref:DUF5357 family protein n=1 Tax=Geitlerinema sp. P-1104 TaxID=2546230 RepID=UPI0014771A86|nr:DUF5357 family protein [Geitlerinema sp. P-1104]NMG58256.1 hypothetical protein [Geitlerinema sp. P-1104]